MLLPIRLLLLLLLIIFNVPTLPDVPVRQLIKITSTFRAVCNALPPPLILIFMGSSFVLPLLALSVSDFHLVILETSALLVYR